MVNLQVIKSADRGYIFLKDSNKIVYSVFISNTGTSRATNVRLKDISSENGRIVQNSVKVNGICEGVILRDMSISIGSIEPGGNSIVTYEVEVCKNCIQNEIGNRAIVSYKDCSYSDSCSTSTEESNLLIIPIIDIDVNVSKNVDRFCAKIGDVLSYTLFIRNDSNVNINNVLLSDYISVDLELFPASVLINGIPQYIENLDEINLGTINAYSSLIVQFKGKVLSAPQNRNLKNEALISFEYTVIENGIETVSIGSACSNSVTTRILEGYCDCSI